jgi:hypothetical protein
MPTFDTPEPISVTLDVGVGDIQVVASEVGQIPTLVFDEVDSGIGGAVAATRPHVQTRAAGCWSGAEGVAWSFRSGRESIDVQIELPPDHR